jgi:plastocyanin
VTRRACTHALLAGLLALVLAPLLFAVPAFAAKTITISLTASGPKPASTTAAIGDTIKFRNDDATFVHQVANKSTNWRFNSGPMPPGAVVTAGTLTKAGEYDYQGVNLDSFTGKVVVPSATTPTTKPAPSPTKAVSPAPTRSAAAPASPAGASPSPTSAAGVTGPPPLAGGFGTGGAPTPAPSARGPAPNVAPTLAGEETSPPPPPTGGAVAVGTGRLPEPPTRRRYGLPAALAAVAAAGVASLLVRLLLAHPAARAARRGRGRGELQVTVD